MQKLIHTIILALSLVDWSVAQSRSISGHVRDTNGDAIVSASVTIDSGVTRRSTTTDNAGYFQFTDIGPGEARIRVSASGFSIYDAAITDAEMNIVLSVSSIVDTITVTRTESRLSDTPQSIVVIRADEIHNDPAPTLDDKLRQIPGFTLFRRSGSRTANPTSQGVSLRGTGGSGASRAAVMVDGFPLNDAFGGWVYWGRVPVESIHSVEVLRGSAGEVSGSSAIGGVIALTSRRPGEKSVLDLDASYASQDTALGSIFSATSLHRWKASLSAEAFHTDGFVAVARNERGRIDTRSGVSRRGVVPFLQYEPNKNVSAFLTGEYFQENRTNGTPLQNNVTKVISPRVGADFTAKKLGTLSFRGWYLTQLYHQSFSSIAADRNSETITRLQVVPSRSTGASLQWTRGFSKKASIFAGSEFRIVSGSSDEIAFIAGRSTSLVNAGGRELTFGIFAGGSYFPTERLILSSGARIDRWREYSGYSDTRPINGNGVTRTTFPERDETAVSPRLSALFRVNKNLSLTGTFSRGFRQPTLNELYRSFRVGNVLTLANQNLQAERAATFEGGLLASLFSDRVYLRAVAFCVGLDQPVANVTLSIAPSLITRQRQNLGSTRSCGLEIDSDLRVRKDLTFSGGYLFADARVREFPTDNSLESLRVPQVPRQQLTFQARYSNSKIATLSLQLRAAGSQFDDDQNLFRLAGFATLDLFASRRLSTRFDVFIAAENLFDSKVEAGRTPVLTLTNPRTIRLGLRLHLSRSGN